MAYSTRDEIIQLKEEILLLYRKLRNQVDNSKELKDEAEVLFEDLLFLIRQTEISEIEEQDATEVAGILIEIKGLRETVEGEIGAKLIN